MKEHNPPKEAIDMPIDWNDHNGWNSFYDSQVNPFEIPKAFQIKKSLRFFQAGKSVWISGCGLELSVWLYSYLGSKVYASDISSSAIQYQKRIVSKNPFNILPNLKTILEELKINPSINHTTPILKISDFRYSIPDIQFDTIINNKAIQGLTDSDIYRIAKNFFKANKKGGAAILSTMNVQGDKRTSIENAFLNAGYKIPNVYANQWYRNKLQETGILYAMVLGNPIIPQWGQYDENGGKKQETKDKETLRSFRDEYRVRLKENYNKDKEGFRPEIDKIAYIIYNTG